MATISIVKRHQLSHQKAKDVAEKIAQDLQKRFALDYVWKGDEVDFERPGCKGRLLVNDDQFKLDVSLGFFLSALKPTIEREIVSQFDKLVGPKTAEGVGGAKGTQGAKHQQDANSAPGASKKVPKKKA